MLEAIFNEEDTALFLVRFKTIAELFYGFVNESGTGLGSTFKGKNEDQLFIRLGV